MIIPLRYEKYIKKRKEKDERETNKSERKRAKQF